MDMDMNNSVGSERSQGLTEEKTHATETFEGIAERALVTSSSLSSRAIDPVPTLSCLQCDSGIFGVSHDNYNYRFKVRVYDAISTKSLWSWPVHGDPGACRISQCTLHIATNRIYALTDEGSLVQVNIGTDAQKVITTIDEDQIDDFVFAVSNSGSHVITGVRAQEQLDLWESDTGNRLQTITHRFRRPVFSFDDQFVMFVSEDRLHVWDCPTFIQPHSYLMPKPVEEDEDRFHHYFVLKPSLRGSLVMVIETEVSHETFEEYASAIYCLNYYEGAVSYRVSLRREDHVIDACFGSTDDTFLLVTFAGIDVYCAQTASVIRTFTVPDVNCVHWNPCKNIMVATTRDDSRMNVYGVLEIDSESGAVVTKSELLFEHPDIYIPRQSVILM
jgi:hypothetical protein